MTTPSYGNQPRQRRVRRPARMIDYMGPERAAQVDDATWAETQAVERERYAVGASLLGMTTGEPVAG